MLGGGETDERCRTHETRSPFPGGHHSPAREPRRREGGRDGHRWGVTQRVATALPAGPSSPDSRATTAKRLKTLQGLTPYEYIVKCWQKEPERRTVNPCHHIITVLLCTFNPVSCVKIMSVGYLP
jgi:hypothetical protein